MHSTSSTGYYLYLFMQALFQLGSYIHAWTNETHSLANLQKHLIQFVLCIIMATQVVSILIACEAYVWYIYSLCGPVHILYHGLVH